MEKILSIKETSFKVEGNDYTSFSGYEIVTDEQTIKVGIDDQQSCCESFGYLTANDDLKDFVGAELKSIAVVDTALNTKVVEKTNDLDSGDAMFVNFETSKGLFQLAAYNSHNGYYGHEAVVISKQLNFSNVL